MYYFALVLGHLRHDEVFFVLLNGFNSHLLEQVTAAHEIEVHELDVARGRVRVECLEEVINLTVRRIPHILNVGVQLKLLHHGQLSVQCFPCSLSKGKLGLVSAHIIPVRLNRGTTFVERGLALLRVEAGLIPAQLPLILAIVLSIDCQLVVVIKAHLDDVS